jgi:hypothetical protein
MNSWKKRAFFPFSKNALFTVSLIQSLKIFSDFFITIGIAQSLQSLGLDLTNPLPAEPELPSDLLQGTLSISSDPETESKDLFLSG